MSSTNDITGQRIKTPVASQAFLDNYDAIFDKKEVVNTDLPDDFISKMYSEGLCSEATYSFNNTHVNRF